MAWFRKKPVVIEAVQWNGDQSVYDTVATWTHGKVLDTPKDELIIPTLEGDHLASLNDWIIKGVKNEVYPCKPDIFAATYEPAEKA